jgi:inhibitor of the pro-sigma K processing machinery
MFIQLQEKGEKNMSINQASVLMVGMCFLVLIIILAKNKIEFIINIILRMVSGMVCIHCLNALFLARGIDLFVGINAGTIGTIGILGIPGFLLIYAISIVQMLA